MTTTTDLGLLPAGVTACSTCPWRVACQDSPSVLENPHAVIVADFYAEAGRQRLWRNWNGTGLGARDGYRISCHCGRGEPGTPNPAPRWCAGADAIQHRSLLRWLDRGRPVNGFYPLTGVPAAKMIVAELLGVDPGDIDDDWTVAGVPISYDQLLAAVHPDVADPAVAFGHLVPPPTVGEIERWAGCPPYGGDRQAAS